MAVISYRKDFWLILVALLMVCSISCISKDGSKKPSDSTEGVPGYLIDPESIKIAKGETDGVFIVRGAEGTIKAASGRPEDVVIGLWSVTAKDFADAMSHMKADGSCPRVNANLLGKFSPNPDGSFDATVHAPEQSLLFITTDQSLTQTTVDPKCSEKSDFTVAHLGLTITGTAHTAASDICPDLFYVLVPGNDVLKTKAFCVMKYEAKKDTSKSIPVSTPDGDSGFVGVFYAGMFGLDGVRKACADLGAGYALMTNDEWMVLAVDIASQGKNWSGGSVGAGTINQGYCDGDAKTEKNATSDDDPYFGTPKRWDQKRTHVLSNGETIWDVSGNAGEVVDKVLMASEEVPARPEATGDGIYLFDVNLFTQPTANLPLSSIRPTHDLFSWWQDSWGVAQGLGIYQAFRPSNPGGFSAALAGPVVMARGSNRGASTSLAGIFTTKFISESQMSSEMNRWTFRCVYHP